MNSTVYALAVNGSDLYVGGIFTTAGGVPANRIARWDGGAWSPLGLGVGGSVVALAASGSDLYVGGGFTTAGGAPANYIAKWNGNTWSALGSGVGSWVRALAVNGSDLYVGGGFTTAGGAPANYIAKWGGSAWSALGSGVGAWVHALAVVGPDLYVGGSFTTAGGSPANFIAKWNGSTWSSLGAGAAPIVRAIVSNGSQVFSGYDNGVSVLNSAVTSTFHPISATVNATYDLTMAYVDTAGLLRTKTYSNNSWSAATTIQDSGFPSAAQLASVPGTSNLVGFWYRSGALEYKKFTNGTWDAAPTTLVSESLNSRFASCYPFAGGGLISCMVTSLSTAPFNISIWSMRP